MLIKWRVITLACIKLQSKVFANAASQLQNAPFTHLKVLCWLYTRTEHSLIWDFFPPCLQSYSSVRKTSNLHLTILFNQRWNPSIWIYFDMIWPILTPLLYSRCSHLHAVLLPFDITHCASKQPSLRLYAIYRILSFFFCNCRHDCTTLHARHRCGS